MSVDKIPLTKRLERLYNDQSSDPKFNIAAVKAMANTPILVYLYAYEDERERLLQLLNITRDEAKSMTYKDVAVLIDKELMPKWEETQMIEAAFILATPFVASWKMKEKLNEQNIA